MYVVPKSQPPAAVPVTTPNMQQAGYASAHVRAGGMSAASNMAVPNMAPQSNMAAGYRVNFPFKIPDHSQSHLYPIPHLKQMPSPGATAAASGTGRHSSQSPQVAAHSPHGTSQSPHRPPQSPHMTSQSPHITSQSPHMTSQSPHMTPQSPHMTPQSPHTMSQIQHLTSQGVHMTAHSPHMTPQSPHMTSQSPHMTSQSPHMTSQSPHMTPHSPHLPSQSLHMTSQSPHMTSQSPHMTSQSPHITSPHLASPHMTSPSPHLSTPSPHFMPSRLTSPLPHLTAQHKMAHSPRLASPHLATPSPRMPSHSPHMASHSPHMTSQSPHMTSQSPRLVPHSPHLTPHSPHLPPSSPLHQQRPPRIDAQEYGRTPERESSYVPLDLTTPKAGGSMAKASADSPLDLSVKANRKREHDDDVIVVGEQLIPFKARRLPESYPPGYPYSPAQPGMHPVGVSGHYVKASGSAIPHPSPYYYAPGGGQHKHQVYRYQSAGSPGSSGAPGQHSSGSSSSAARSGVWERQPQPPTTQQSPQPPSYQQAASAGTVRTEGSSSSSAHMNGVRHTYPYTVSVSGNHAVVQHPHASANIRGVASGSIRYVYPANSHQNSSSTRTTPPAPAPQGGSTVCATTIRVPMSPTHRAMSQERTSHGPPPLQTLTPQRTPPVEKLPEARGQQPSHITMLESPGSVQSHLAAMQYARGSSGVIQHVGPASSAVPYDAHKYPYQPPATPTNGSSSHGEPVQGRPHSHNLSSSSSDVTITGHYQAQQPVRHGGQEEYQAQAPHSMYPGGTQLSIPKYSQRPAITSATSNATAAQPAYIQYNKVPPESYLPPGHQGAHYSTGSKDVNIGGSSSSSGQVGRIQPFHQATTNGTSPHMLPPQYHQSHPGTYPQHHQTAPAPGTVPTTRGYIQVPSVHMGSYSQHLAPTTTMSSSSTTSLSTPVPLPRAPLSSSGVPAHIYSATVRPTAGQPWPMSNGAQLRPGVDFSPYSSTDPSMLLPKKPVANVNPIVQRKSPSLLHHKKQMLHQSRLESSPPGGPAEPSMCQGGQGTEGQHAGGKPPSGDLNSNQNNNMVSSMVSEARYSTFKHLLPATDRTQMEIKPDIGELPEKVPNKPGHLDFSKLSRGLDTHDTFRPYEALIKLEQQEQLLKPLNHPPTELKIPNVPLKERMKPKDHFGRASPITMDEATKGAKLNKSPESKTGSVKAKDKAGKPKEPQNAKIHKYYSVKAKPSTGGPRKAQMPKPKKCKKGSENEPLAHDKVKVEGVESPEGASAKKTSVEGDEKPKKRAYRRKKLMDGFTKPEGGAGRGRKPRVQDGDESGPKRGRSRNTEGEDKRKGKKPRITKPLSDAKRRKQGAHNVVLTTRTRTQTAATHGVGRLSSACYNKNAAYERELKREEYRKIIKRFKRQNKRQRCGRESVRVTRERLGVIFQSDSGSEEDDDDDDEDDDDEDEDEYDDYREGRGTPTSTTSQRSSSRGGTMRKRSGPGSGPRRYRRQPDPRDSNLDDDDDNDDDNVDDEFTDEYGDEDTTRKVRRSRGGRRGHRGSSRGGFTKTRHDDDVDNDDEDDDDAEYRPAGNLSRFDFIDDEEDEIDEAEDNEDEEQDDDSEFVDADESQRPAPPSRSKASPGPGLAGRPGRGRGGRVFRRRGGAWYDKRQKKKKPYTPKEKLERECLERRAMEDCAGQETLSAPEMARRLVICKDTGETLLHKAARLGLDDVVLHSLETGFDVNSRDNAGYTPLHETCVRGHVTAARMLISHGADINANAHDGTRPMHDAVDNNNLQIVRLLLACGVDTKLVSFGGRDVMKLAKGDAMRQLLRGYFGDLNGANTERGWEEIPWVFSSSGVIDDGFRTGCDVLADVPPEADDVEGYVEFDFCDTPHLPVYYLHIVPTKGALNYHVLEDVLSRLGRSKDAFVMSHPDVEILQYERKSIPGLPVKDEPLPSSSKSVPGGPDGSSDTTEEDLIDVLELTNELRSILGIETEQMPAILPLPKVNSHKDQSPVLEEKSEVVSKKEESLHQKTSVEDAVSVSKPMSVPTLTSSEAPVIKSSSKDNVKSFSKDNAKSLSKDNVKSSCKDSVKSLSKDNVKSSCKDGVKSSCKDNVPASVTEPVKMSDNKESSVKSSSEQSRKPSCDQVKPEAAATKATSTLHSDETHVHKPMRWRLEKCSVSAPNTVPMSCSPRSTCSLPTSASSTTVGCPSGACSPNVMARHCDFHSEVRPVPGEKKLLTVPLIAVTSGITSVTLPTAAKLSTSMVTAVVPLVQVSSAASVRLRTSTPASLPAGAIVSTTSTLSKPLIHSVPVTQSTLVSLPLTAKQSSVKSSIPSMVKAASSVSAAPPKPLTAKVDVPSKPLTTKVEMIPSKPLTTKVEMVPSKPLAAKDDMVPSKPLTAKDDMVPSKPLTAKDDMVPSRPLTAKDDIVPSKPMAAKADVVPSKPLTAKVDMVPSKPLTTKVVVVPSRPLTSKVDMVPSKPLPVKDEVTAPEPLTAMAEMTNSVSDSKSKSADLKPPPPPECPSTVDLMSNAEAAIAQTKGAVKIESTMAQVPKHESEDNKQLNLNESVKQQAETVPEKPHEEKGKPSQYLKVDKVKKEEHSPVVSNPKQVTSDTTTAVRPAKPDTILPSSLYNSLIDVVAQTTTSTSADFNMAPLYTGVAFLSNIPLEPPSEHNVSALRVSNHDFVISTVGSQEDNSRVSKTCDDNDREKLCSGTSMSSDKDHIASNTSTDAEQSNCGLVEDDSKCTNRSRLNTDNKPNNPGCDRNNSSSTVSGSKPLTADQQVAAVSESATVTNQQGNTSPHNTLHGQRQQGSATSDIAEMKIADAPGSSLKQLAQKRQSGEERSISPKAAETMPQEADNIPSTCDGAATPSSDNSVAPPGGEQKETTPPVVAPGGEARKESNNNIASEEAPVDTALPVLEKHERGENEEGAPQDKSVAEPTTDDSTDDMEMPQLTIQAY